ncbi:DUF362 domain-containing protein [Halorubrum sp. DTA98]|uniref:DUF362 domain-containing protein n=1 Tax=Halorubrum sp. DTA98 TaxID=3402163 RepID=UPI003AAEF393
MEFPDRSFVEDLVDPRPLPSFVRISTDPDAETIDDPGRAARAALADLALADLEPGSTVAVGVGSRGIASIESIVVAVVDDLRERGFDPVLVPAMGSHGGATAEGQRSVLESLGITADRVGAPIDARMDIERVATVDVGGERTPVNVAKAALEADGIVVVNRVKPHTNFTGPIESGLCKMLAVGLGKQPGANAFHSTAVGRGYVETIEAFVEAIRESTPTLGGVAVVENSHEEVAAVEGIRSDELLDREPALLDRAREEMPTLPIDELDILVVDEIGKEISGAGMDTNVIGRYRVLNAPDPETPAIDLIYVRGLTAETKGNGSGIGLADVTRRDAVDDLDLHTVYANAITSGSLSKAMLPVVTPDDETAIHTMINALGAYDPETVRIAWIRNTAELDTLRVSTAVAEALDGSVTVQARERLTFSDGTASFEPNDD